ncbi:helix-turn-helix domain-containing protein [Streptomyces sp. NPDC088124]|uniref:helix-turn-helix domain-containing protein n=1 Tax=Streptomyces sp. NPDC088124 TaxID=3154654 RepID=UPI00342DB7E1
MPDTSPGHELSAAARSLNLPRLDPGQRLAAPERAVLLPKFESRYDEGSSIRLAGEALGRSCGGTHRLLTGIGIELRPKSKTKGQTGTVRKRS